MTRHLDDRSGRQRSTILPSAMRKMLTPHKTTLRPGAVRPSLMRGAFRGHQVRRGGKLGLVDACPQANTANLAMAGHGRRGLDRDTSRLPSGSIGEQGGDQFLGNPLVASDGHAAMISRPPPRHHWFTDRMTSERTHIFWVVAALAGLFFVVAAVLMASAP
jgi:hypothetical protein